MSRLEQKLVELGYKKYSPFIWKKDDIHITLISNKTLHIEYCYVDCNKWIQNRNDIQAILKEIVEHYNNQLKIMQKDLEELKLCQG